MEKEKKYLSDILFAIDLIDEFLLQVGDFKSYVADRKTKSAVERQLAIIGEAVNKYLRLDESNTLNHAQKIISFRNWLVHAYDTIDDTIVWAITQNHLPALKQEVTDKLSL